MINLHPTLFFLLLEALAGVTALALMLALFAIRRRRHRRTALVDLVQRIKNTGDVRRESIAQVLRESGVSDDERLTALTQQVLTAETHFYQFLVRALLSSDDRSLLDLDRQVEALTDAITRCSPALKNVPAVAGSAHPAAAAEINAELGHIKQAVTALQNNHQQIVAEVKSSAASLRDALQQFANQGVIAVATAAAGAAVAATPMTPEPDPSNLAPNHDALESLPDIDDAATTATLTKETSPVAAPAPMTRDTAPNIDQIAEIPDELLMGVGEISAESAGAATAGATLEFTEDFGASVASPGTPVNTLSDQIAAIPDELLAADLPTAVSSAATPAPAIATSPTADNNPYRSDAEALIDDLLADAAASSKAVFASTQAASSAAEAGINASPELSVDEIYAAAPLIPDGEEPSTSAPSGGNATAAANASSPDARKDEQDTSQSKSYGNVDDLLAELDDLLK